MKWYEGDIAQAVITSKSKNAVFVVYVEGKDDISSKLTAQINENHISNLLESETFVSIKITAGSIIYHQFAAIYKNVPVPSLFFIGKNGNPIDTVLDSASVRDLHERINSVIDAHFGVSPSSSFVTTTSPSPSDAFIETETASMEMDNFAEDESITSNNIISECASVTASDSNMQILDSEAAFPLPSTCNLDNTEAAASFLNEEKQASQEEKVQRAKELLEKTRELKKQEEDAAEKLKEIERRKMGRDVQGLRRRQQDQELKNLMEERQRTKNEEKAARDRILAQIASDKADRAARFGTPLSAASSAEPVVTRHVLTTNHNMARLQFRLPDGTTTTHEFQSNDTLQEVRNYVILNLKPPFKYFSLSTTFPRREFTENDYEETLKDLELCPTAVILILAGNAANTVSSSSSGGFMSMIWFILSPIIGIYDYFRSFFVRSSNDSSNRNVGNRRSAPDSADSNISPPIKRKATEKSLVRRQGNIHHLRDKKDSDDENNTWNGNSTQQM